MGGGGGSCIAGAAPWMQHSPAISRQLPAPFRPPVVGGDEYDLLDLGSSLAPPDYAISSLRGPLDFGFGQGGYRWFEGKTLPPWRLCCSHLAINWWNREGSTTIS